LLTEGAGRAEHGHTLGRLQVAAGGHDLAPDVADVLALQRALVDRLQVADHLRFALGAIDHRAFCPLDLTDLARQRGALVEQTEQLLIQRINLLAELVESFGHVDMFLGV
jgi:hypothetical protein